MGSCREIFVILNNWAYTLFFVLFESFGPLLGSSLDWVRAKITQILSIWGIGPSLGSICKFWVEDRASRSKNMRPKKVSFTPFLCVLFISVSDLLYLKNIYFHNFWKLEALPGEPAVLKLIMRCVILVHPSRTFWILPKIKIYSRSYQNILHLNRAFLNLA